MRGRQVLAGCGLAFAMAASVPCALAAETPDAAATAAKFSAEQIDFFAREVAPILKSQCFNCHGAEPKLKGELRLTTREGILTGGDSGPAVSLDKPADSLLLQAVRYESLEMPPKGKLPQAQIDILTKWVSMGLPWSDEAAAIVVKTHGPPQVDDKARNFWAFKPVVRPSVPETHDKTWGRNPIDAFVLAKLEAQGFRPAVEADKPALLRRLYYAVTGLPPIPEEVEEFVADTSADAYEKRVDQLLASRHYGEHWGRHWLDLVRFAETNSFERDGPKPNAWKYRDYVIRAFNDDKPYDQFIREQLAGDELQPVTRDSAIATGFYRLGLWDDEPADQELAYYDQLDDIVSTTGQTFLGLTVGCARCHDHKLDPFPQKDYYRLLAFFHGINNYGSYVTRSGMQRILDSSASATELDPNAGTVLTMIKPMSDDAESPAGKAAEFEKKLAKVVRQLRKIEELAAEKLVAGERDDFANIGSRPAILKNKVGSIISPEEFARYRQLSEERDELNRNRPPSIETAMVVIEQGPIARETYLLGRGTPANKEEKLEPGFPSALCAAGTRDPEMPPVPADALSSGRRRVVADWIASGTNPLTSRVMANRLWQYNFGRGIVRSSSNFGYQGTPPTHPELLDWLASELVASGMKIKPLQRLLLTSSTFRMSSQADPTTAAKDPENDLLSHFDLRRLTGEEVRDSILKVSGQLNLRKTSGPGVYPKIPQEVLAGQSRPGDGWGKSSPVDAASRSVFVYVKRSLALPILASFDAPDPDGPCPVRFTTTQPSQALGMLNSEFVGEQSRSFASRLKREVPDDARGQVRLVLRHVTQRTPSDAEIDRGLQFIAKMRDEEKLSADEALTRFCLLALNLNEFVMIH